MPTILSHFCLVEWASGAGPKVIGVHPAKALDRWPILWSVDPSCWGERLDVLRDLDLDVAKIVTASPSVLSHPSETLRLKLAALSQMGLHAAKVVKNCPSVFSLHDERIRLLFKSGGPSPETGGGAQKEVCTESGARSFSWTALDWMGCLLSTACPPFYTSMWTPSCGLLSISLPSPWDGESLLWTRRPRAFATASTAVWCPAMNSPFCTKSSTSASPCCLALQTRVLWSVLVSPSLRTALLWPSACGNSLCLANLGDAFFFPLFWLSFRKNQRSEKTRFSTNPGKRFPQINDTIFSYVVLFLSRHCFPRSSCQMNFHPDCVLFWKWAYAENKLNQLKINMLKRSSHKWKQAFGAVFVCKKSFSPKTGPTKCGGLYLPLLKFPTVQNMCFFYHFFARFFPNGDRAQPAEATHITQKS